MKKWLAALLFTGIYSCSPKIISYQNPQANFSAYETYRIVSPKVDQSPIETTTSSILEVIREEIEREMDKREYKMTAIDPDLTLRYELTSETRTETIGQPSVFNPIPQVNSRTIHESILLLELLDKNKKLVWQGSYNLKQKRKESEIKNVLRDAVTIIFTTYPYKALEKERDLSLLVYEKKKKQK